jgi:hypothetical protein
MQWDVAPFDTYVECSLPNSEAPRQISQLFKVGIFPLGGTIEKGETETRIVYAVPPYARLT